MIPITVARAIKYGSHSNEIVMIDFVDWFSESKYLPSWNVESFADKNATPWHTNNRFSPNIPSITISILQAFHGTETKCVVNVNK